MQTMTATTFNAVWGMMLDARCKVRIGGTRGTVIQKALTVGISREQFDTEQGSVNTATGNVRYLIADEPRMVAIGDVVEVDHGKGEWTRFRVLGRREVGGMVTLRVDAEFE